MLQSLRRGAPLDQNTAEREAQTIGDVAAAAVSQAERLKTEIMALIERGRTVADDLERDGLALIEMTQQQQIAFNDRCQRFFESTDDLHAGLRDIMKKIGTRTAAAEPPAETGTKESE